MKKRINVEMLLRHLGINAKRSMGGKWEGRCPSPAHDDHSPSWTIIDRPGDRRHGSHHCKACSFGGGPWELAAAIWDVSLEEAGSRLRTVMTSGGPVKLPKVVIAPQRSRVFALPFGVVIPETIDDWYEPALTYLRGRGVTDAQILRWGIGYAIRGRCRLRVVLPVYTGGELRTYSARAFAPGIRRYDAGFESQGARPSEAIFGEPLFDYDLDTVTIAEGCFSVLALERAGAPNPCGILSSELTPGRILTLGRFKRIFVATDPDAAGDKVFRAISPLARYGTITRFRFRKSPDDMPHDELSSFFG